MSLVDQKQYNSYMKTYMRERRQKKKQEALQELGPFCHLCGSMFFLQFDHKDPSTKEDTISNMIANSNPETGKELIKCQTICPKCHIEKSIKEGSFDNKETDVICACGKQFFTTKQYAGHKTWCKL